MTEKRAGGAAAVGALAIAGVLVARNLDTLGSAAGKAAAGSDRIVAGAATHAGDLSHLSTTLDHAPRRYVDAAPLPRPLPTVIPLRAPAYADANKAVRGPGGERATIEVMTLARKTIDHQALASQTALPRPAVTGIIHRDLAQAAARLAARSPETVRFDLLTGKLVIAAHHRWGRVTLGYGEVNTYKLASIAAAAVIACREMKASNAEACAKQALDGVAKIAIGS